MKTTRLAAMLAMAGASLCAGQSAAAQKATVTVCMEPDPLVLMGVRPLASAMFASIGVRIDWRERDSCPVGVGAIQVRLSHDSTSIAIKFRSLGLCTAVRGDHRRVSRPRARVESQRGAVRDGTCAGSRDHACPRRNRPAFGYWHHEGSLER